MNNFDKKMTLPQFKDKADTLNHNPQSDNGFSRVKPGVSGYGHRPWNNNSSVLKAEFFKQCTCRNPHLKYW